MTPAGVVKPGELPPTWGLYEVQDSGKFKTVSEAPPLSPQPIERKFVAAMLRRASSADEEEVRALVAAEVEAARAQDRKWLEREVESRTRRYEDLRKVVADIERTSGVKINSWSNGEEIGRALKLVIDTGALNTYGGIRGLRNQLETTLKEFDKALAEFMPERTESAA